MVSWALVGFCCGVEVANGVVLGGFGLVPVALEGWLWCWVAFGSEVLAPF